jgi:hypothetical protein
MKSQKLSTYRLENSEWSLEIVAEDGTSTIWDDLFSPYEAALAEAFNAIKEDGIRIFSLSSGSVVRGGAPHTH